MGIISYVEMLNKLQSDRCHLLFGNGFNLSLGVNTSYKEIFHRMKSEFPIYNKIEKEIEQLGYDIEQIIGKLNQSINSENEFKDFIGLFLHNKIKFDFMKAAISIVTENIKEIYQEKNEGIYLLFQKFKNYFTLNYDPFLYLILMKFKKDKIINDKAIVFQAQQRLIEETNSPEENDILKIIHNAYENGKLILSYQDNQISSNLKQTTKADFRNQIKKILKKKYPNITNKEIKKATNQYLDLLYTNQRILNINDGFNGELFPENTNNTNQNVFFLHGAFHIYKKGKKICKITQTSEQALYQKLEEIIDDNKQEIVCIFESDNKEDKISDNIYLSHSLNKLSEIEGELVIFGSALSDNDNHIFERINNNEKINKIYISTSSDRLEETQNKANIIFSKKECEYFDYKTVSYVGM